MQLNHPETIPHLKKNCLPRNQNFVTPGARKVGDCCSRERCSCSSLSSSSGKYAEPREESEGQQLAVVFLYFWRHEAAEWKESR